MLDARLHIHVLTPAHGIPAMLPRLTVQTEAQPELPVPVVPGFVPGQADPPAAWQRLSTPSARIENFCRGPCACAVHTMACETNNGCFSSETDMKLARQC